VKKKKLKILEVQICMDIIFIKKGKHNFLEFKMEKPDIQRIWMAYFHRFLIYHFWKFNIFIIFFFNLQVEQLHKIFKLCGSPSDDFWKRSKLSNATMFKPQHPYESSLQERCKDIPAAALNLMETLLSIEPEKRGTASAALLSQVSLTKTNPLTLQFPD